MDSEATNRKLLCKSTACVNTSTNTAYTDIHNNNVPSLGLEQQHEELCSNTLRGGKTIRENVVWVYIDTKKARKCTAQSITGNRTSNHGD